MIHALVLAALVAHPSVFRIDPSTASAGFDLKATMHTVHGTTTKVSGEVRVTPESDGALGFSGRIEIDAASLATGNARRDATMREKTLAVAANPAIVFAPERFTIAGAPRADGTVSGTLSGQITIRGKTRPQRMAATLTEKADRILVSGTFDVSWADFGAPDPSFAFVRIERVAHARFRVEFVPVP